MSLQLRFSRSASSKTLRQSNVAVAKSRFGVPGLGYAVVRDCAYWSATQKQVQTPKPSWWEELTMQFGVVAVPLVCDTLSVRVAEKGFKLPSEPAKVFAVACPPVALLGRMTWIPVYNYAYVLAQQRFGDASPIHEGLGLLVGSLAASYVAYPLFVFKTNLLLCHDGGGALDVRRTLNLCREAALKSCNASSFSGLRRPAVTAAGAVMKGANPHAIANIGPDGCAWARRARRTSSFGGSVKGVFGPVPLPSSPRTDRVHRGLRRRRARRRASGFSGGLTRSRDARVLGDP